MVDKTTYEDNQGQKVTMNYKPESKLENVNYQKVTTNYKPQREDDQGQHQIVRQEREDQRHELMEQRQRGIQKRKDLSQYRSDQVVQYKKLKEDQENLIRENQKLQKDREEMEKKKREKEMKDYSDRAQEKVNQDNFLKNHANRVQQNRNQRDNAWKNQQSQILGDLKPGKNKPYVPTQLIKSQNELKKVNQKLAGTQPQSKQKVWLNGVKQPSKPIVNSEGIKASIKGAAKHPLDTAMGNIGKLADKVYGNKVSQGTMGWMADALVKERTQKQVNQQFTQESRRLSTVVRNKNLGKNPFTTVIGVGDTRQIAYQTDGHGRSGKRATLEWRREHRQYTSPERAAKAGINQDWVANVTGTNPAPVRHRKGSGESALDRFTKML